MQRQLSITPSITVTIGRHTRQYFAYITTAPVELDSPATLTLHAGTFAELVGFTADCLMVAADQARMPGRLVLVEAMELTWQHAKYHGHHHPLFRADAGLVGLDTLQHWLWRRLQASATSPVAA